MPVYEYICRDCGRAFERYVQRWSESVACPSCDGAQVEKQLSTFSMAGGAGSAGGSGGGAMAGGGGCWGGGGCGCH